MIKKILFAFALVLMLGILLLVFFTYDGDDGNVDNDISGGDNAEKPFEPCMKLEFTSNGDGTCYVSGIGECRHENVVIPSKSPGGDKVSGIGEHAFSGCSRTSIIIPDSVTSIGDYAFENCTNLTSITIGNGVTDIGKDAFRYCDSLKSVYITNIAAWCGISFNIDETNSSCYSNPLRYAKNLYLNGELVTELVIPNSITSLGDYVFYACDSLTSVIIRNSVESIGDYAFEGCTSLTSVTIGNSVESIGDYAFEGCTSLGSVTIPDGVQEIGRAHV